MNGDTLPRHGRIGKTLAAAGTAMRLLGRGARRRFRKRVALQIHSFRAFVINVCAICIVAAVGAVVVQETLRDKVEVAPIDVPADLEAAGYTPKVIAERLVDGVARIEAASKTNMARRGAALKEQGLDITVPGSSLSIGTVASALRKALGAHDVQIAGEITELQGMIWLQLRITGKETIGQLGGIPVEQVDEAIAAGAREIVRAIEPLILGAYLYDLDPSAALDIAKSIQATMPDEESTYRAYNLEGNILLNRKDYEGAIASFHKALELNPRFALTYYYLAGALRAEKRLDEAITSYHKAIELNPRFSEAYNNLGYTLDANKQPDEAIVAYRRAVELNPKNAIAYNNLGLVLNEKNQVDDAIVAYRKAIEINPKYSIAYYDLGAAFDDKKRFEEAIASYRKAIVLNPKYVFAFNRLADDLRSMKQLDEAIGFYRKAMELAPKFVEAYYDLGIALTDKGQLGEACSVLKDGSRLAPGDTRFATAMEKIDLILSRPLGCNP